MNGAGLVATDWTSIFSYAQATGRVSGGWELETLAKMCTGYTGAFHDGKHPIAMPPVEQDQPEQE